MSQTLTTKPSISSQTSGNRPPVNSNRSWLRTIAELIVILPISLLLLEGGLNLAGVGQEEFLEPDPVLGVRHIAGKKVVWRLEGFSDESFSAAGLRDTEHSVNKPSGVFRVALLGDSATEGMQVPLADTYGKQLELLLNKEGGLKGQPVEVINFGCSSYSNGQELIQLKHQVLQYQPDLVVLMYNRGDYVENIRDPRTPKAEPRPYFYCEQNGELQQDRSIMDANKALYDPQPVTDFLRRNSRIYGVLQHLNLALSLNEAAYAKIKNSISKKLDRRPNGEKAYVQPYPIQNVWNVTESIIKEIQTTCKQNQASMLVVCFPNIVNDKDYKTQIKRLGEIAPVEDFGFIDLTYPFMYSKDPKALFLKYHFSSAGHRMAAESLKKLCQQRCSP